MDSPATVETLKKFLEAHGKTFERGPVGMRTLLAADGEPTQDEIDAEMAAPKFDTSILDHVLGRLVKRSPFSEPILAIEILDGPYAGIVFSFASFTFLPAQGEDQMVPTKYETEVHLVPPSLKDTFVKDEDFDHFTTEILLAWIGYIHTNDLSPLIKMRARTI